MNDPTSQVDRRLEELVQMALQIGADAIDVVAISPSDISVEDDLANFCREPRCGYYGLSANCPPYVSGPSGFRELLKICKHALAIKMEVPLGTYLTDEQYDILKFTHETVAGIERLAVELGYSNSKAFAAGNCKVFFCREYDRCRVLTGGECRHPQHARPSMSSSGINVYELKKTAGWLMNRDTNEANPDPKMEAVYGLVLIG